jgi:predicted acyl esterase
VRRVSVLVVCGLLAAPLALAVSPAAAQQAPDVTVVPLELTVLAGPPEQEKECTVLGDLYLPSTATPSTPAAAIMATNGFGGSKDDAGPRGNATVARHYADRGYVGLSYSGLGFGGSGCEIYLNQPEWDGRVGDILAQFLGGREGLAVRTDTGEPYAVDGLVRTEVGALAHDPVVGMIGVSYGGEVQFATAKHGRLDAIVPQITWNDLSYSLAPNNTDFRRTALDPRSVTSGTPGVAKIGWTSLFFTLGVTQDLSNSRPEDLLAQLADAQRADAQQDPTAPVPCPNFDRRACSAVLDLAADGAPAPGTLELARSASVASYLDDIDLPVLLSQGQADTLFNLQEAIATWSALTARDRPVKMVWHSWGHSTAAPKPGELDHRLPAEQTYLAAMYAAWFDHHLLGLGPEPSLDTEYFREWLAPQGGTADEVAAAYGRAAGYPVAPTQALYLTGVDGLTADRGAVQDGAAQFAAVVPAGLPSSYSEFPVVAQDEPPRDTPGTFAQFTTPPLPGDLDLGGVPALTVQLSRTLPGGPLPDGARDLVLCAKLYNVAPDGTVHLQHRLVSAARIGSFDEPVRIELPGVVQRVPAGHRLAVVLAASDAGYRGNVVPGDVTVTTTSAAPGVLELPVLAGALPVDRPAPPPMAVTGAAEPASGATAGGVAAAPARARSLPATGAAGLPPLAAITAVGGALLLRRRLARRPV